MENQNKVQMWYYLLPSGAMVTNQKEGCQIMEIGRNAFRNRVKSGEIKKVVISNRPKGYEAIESTIW